MFFGIFFFCHVQERSTRSFDSTLNCSQQLSLERETVGQRSMPSYYISIEFEFFISSISSFGNFKNNVVYDKPFASPCGRDKASVLSILETASWSLVTDDKANR